MDLSGNERSCGRLLRVSVVDYLAPRPNCDAGPITVDPTAQTRGLGRLMQAVLDRRSSRQILRHRRATVPRTITFMLSGLVAALAASDAGAEWYGPDYRQCAEMPTAQLVACVKKRAGHWDRELNRGLSATDGWPGPAAAGTSSGRPAAVDSVSRCELRILRCRRRLHRGRRGRRMPQGHDAAPL